MRTPKQEGTKILLRSKQGKRKWLRRKLKDVDNKSWDVCLDSEPINGGV